MIRYISKDELWPFYTISSDKYEGDKFEWPSDLSFEAYAETMQRFWAWQMKLKEIYNQIKNKNRFKL